MNKPEERRKDKILKFRRSNLGIDKQQRKRGRNLLRKKEKNFRRPPDEKENSEKKHLKIIARLKEVSSKHPYIVLTCRLTYSLSWVTEMEIDIVFQRVLLYNFVSAASEVRFVASPPTGVAPFTTIFSCSVIDDVSSSGNASVFTSVMLEELLVLLTSVSRLNDIHFFLGLVVCGRLSSFDPIRWRVIIEVAAELKASSGLWPSKKRFRCLWKWLVVVNVGSRSDCKLLVISRPFGYLSYILHTVQFFNGRLIRGLLGESKAWRSAFIELGVETDSNSSSMPSTTRISSVARPPIRTSLPESISVIDDGAWELTFAFVIRVLY